MTTLWIVWIVIGVIGGYMGAKLLLSDDNLIGPLLVAIAGSVLGGWLYVKLLGMTEQNGYLSLITSMIICALFLWVYCSIHDRVVAKRRRRRDGVDDPE